MSSETPSQAPAPKLDNNALEKIKLKETHIQAWKGIATGFASSTNLKSRLEHYLVFVKTILGAKFDCFITKGKKVKYLVPGHFISSDHTKIANVADKESIEISDSTLFVRRINLFKHHDFVLFSTEDVISDAVLATLKKHALDMGLTKYELPIKSIMAAAILIVFLFIPFAAPNKGEATAPGELRLSVVTQNPGTLVPLVKGGEVKKGQIIAQINTGELENEAKILTSQLNEKRVQLSQSSATQNQSIYQLNAQLVSTRAQLDGVKEKLKHNTITAPRDGMLIWASTDVNRFLNAGDPIASIDDIRQSLVKVRIAVKDWRPANNVSGVYTSHDSETRVKGHIEVAPSVVFTDQGRAEYEVDFRLDEPITLGDSGIVVFFGEDTTLFELLLKTPIKYLTAWLYLNELI